MAALDQGELEAKEFRRDSAGYLITLSPKQPASGAIAGGGGVVRVDRCGRATVATRYP